MMKVDKEPVMYKKDLEYFFSGFLMGIGVFGILAFVRQTLSPQTKEPSLARSLRDDFSQVKEDFDSATKRFEQDHS